VVDEEAAESEISQIYTSQQAYLELIRHESPSPPLIEYAGRCGEVEETTYGSPIKELIIEEEIEEETPEYQAVPVKDLINTFEQGKLNAFCCFLIPLISASAIISGSFRFAKINKMSNQIFY
jgi:hypothetical protein